MPVVASVLVNLSDSRALRETRSEAQEDVCKVCYNLDISLSMTRLD